MMKNKQLEKQIKDVANNFDICFSQIMREEPGVANNIQWAIKQQLDNYFLKLSSKELNEINE